MIWIWVGLFLFTLAVVYVGGGDPLSREEESDETDCSPS